MRSPNRVNHLYIPLSSPSDLAELQTNSLLTIEDTWFLEGLNALSLVSCLSRWNCAFFFVLLHWSESIFWVSPPQEVISTWTCLPETRLLCPLDVAGNSRSVDETSSRCTACER